jgi:hypothetical protein
MDSAAQKVGRLVVAAATAVTLATTASAIVGAQAPAPAKGVKYSQVSPAELKDWLTYLASDELQGRQIYTEGYGLAAGFISEKLRDWGVKPIGSNGTYLQIVKNRGYKVDRKGSVVVEAGGKSMMFKQGEHVTFPTNSGGKQTRVFSGVQYVGSTLAPGTDLKGKTAVLIAPSAGAGRGGRNVAGNLANAAGATGTITFSPAPPAPTAADQALAEAQDALTKAQAAVQQAQAQLAGRGGRGAFGFGGGGRGRGALPEADITTVLDMNAPAPIVGFSGDETFFEFLLSASDVKFNDLKARIDKGEAVPSFAINAKVTVNVDNQYEVVSQQLAHNVVGMIEGTDPKLKDTYVLFGAHLDHVGYSTVGTGNPGSPSGCRTRSDEANAATKAAGKTVVKAPGGPGAGGRGARAGGAALDPTRFDTGDFISNGADDDGSGSTALLGVAKAFATGPRPKRSVVFVWHVGEEAGLLGSRYNADFPIVPLDKVQAQLNMDMVGRDDCDDMEGDYTNSVFVVGADRISTDLHNLIVETNGTMVKPLQLDYEMNDPNDPESVYTRSDHYSYAAKGIPIAFFTTGLHPDYHRVTDTADKILYPKMARISQLVYETGFSIANTERTLERDNKGPRTGFGKGGIIKK